ncbi:hypothetical protein J14TS2_38860 [Bacillus sp. J14TS2]|nr:hypothetical protein [Bacillus sp. J14TS2]GIN73411.1 hypothetical protein J14TS2_38860 [Bacillus sp. J14TS2]
MADASFHPSLGQHNKMKKVKAGDGQPLKPHRLWHILRRSVFCAE